MSFRIGHGYDIHRTLAGRRMVLGGICFEDCQVGLDGHSDADVLTHAICDALLGAAALPDIGHFFPNTDLAFKNIDSQLLLERTCEALRERGFEIENIDATVLAELPKIAPRLEQMRSRLATSCAISPDRLGLKATTNEGSDDIGRGLAVALIKRL
jgi:2-C-methyl-D-erythritol 2,4-cyclodiphosphate synthase